MSIRLDKWIEMKVTNGLGYHDNELLPQVRHGDYALEKHLCLMDAKTDTNDILFGLKKPRDIVFRMYVPLRERKYVDYSHGKIEQIKESIGPNLTWNEIKR